MTETTKPTYKTVTLEELGPRLPLGSGSKKLVTKPWRLKEEKQLSSLREKSSKKSKMASYISTVICTMYESIDDITISDLSEVEKKRLISTMYMGDVLYAYVWLRQSSLGNVFNCSITCPACRTNFPFPADLHTLEVNTANTVEDTMWLYNLRDPINIQGKEVSKLKMKPVKWGTVETISNLKTPTAAATKALLIKGSICEIPEHPDLILSSGCLDELSKYDYEKLTKLIDKNNLGPDMSIETECTACSSDIYTSIDWSYDNFFGYSSPSSQ